MDAHPYLCTECGGKFGTQRFDIKDIDNQKNRGIKKLQCKKCKNLSAANVTILRGKVRKSEWHCKCACLLHTERCPLSPAYFGERRWPGKDKELSAEDKLFLDDLVGPFDAGLEDVTHSFSSVAADFVSGLDSPCHRPFGRTPDSR